MGYADAAKQSSYQTEWVKKRRAEWIASQGGKCLFPGCCETQNLQVVKDDPSVPTSKVFAWGDELREKILKKCTVLCVTHKREKHAEECRRRLTGKPNSSAHGLTPEVVCWMLRGRLLGRESTREIARQMKIDHRVVMSIQRGRTYKWLVGGRRKVYGIQKVGE